MFETLKLYLNFVFCIFYNVLYRHNYKSIATSILSSQFKTSITAAVFIAHNYLLCQCEDMLVKSPTSNTSVSRFQPTSVTTARPTQWPSLPTRPAAQATTTVATPGPPWGPTVRSAPTRTCSPQT